GGLPIWIADLDIPAIFLAGEPFILTGEVAVPIAVDVHCVAVQDDPDTELGLRTKEQQGVLWGRFVGRFLADGAVKLGIVNRVSPWAEGHQAESDQAEGGTHGNPSKNNLSERRQSGARAHYGVLWYSLSPAPPRRKPIRKRAVYGSGRCSS